MQQSTRGETTASASAPPVRVPSWAWPLITVCALLLGATAIIRGTSALVTAADSDLTNFFFPSAQYILHGAPFHIYAVNVGGYPDYNPPLSIFLMAPLLWLAQAVGFAANYGEQITFVALPFIVLVPVLGYLVVRALRRLYPAIPETQALLAYALVALSPLTWQTYGTWYHVEQPLMLCFLIVAVLALQRRHAGVAGVFAALAVLSRTTAIMPLLALGVLLLVAREWRTLVTFAGVGAVLTLAALAPFFLVDPTDTKYSLLTWRGGAPVGGNTIWALFSYGDTHGHLLSLIASVAKRLDMYVVVLFILVVAFLAARRLRVSAFDRDAWAVMAVAFLAVPMLSKTSWPYYLLEPFIFLLVWEFASMHDRRAGVWRWPVLSLAYLAVAATLSQYIGLRSVGYGDRVVVGLLESGTLFAFAILIHLRVKARKAPAPDPVLAGAAVPTGATGTAGSATPAAGPSATPANQLARPNTERVPAPSYLQMGLQTGADAASSASRGPWSPPGVTQGAAFDKLDKLDKLDKRDKLDRLDNGPASPPWSLAPQGQGAALGSAPDAPPSIPFPPAPGFGAATPPTTPRQPLWPGDPSAQPRPQRPDVRPDIRPDIRSNGFGEGAQSGQPPQGAQGAQGRGWGVDPRFPGAPQRER